MTTSTQNNIPTSSCDDPSKTLVTDKSQTCPHCGNSAPHYQDPDFPNIAVRCRTCGRKATDVLCFYIVDKKTGCIASPEFSTLDEAKQFADIFGMTSYAGYGLRECTYLINGQRDEQARRYHLERLAWAGQMLASLIELRPAYTEGVDGLKTLAVFLHLDRYALPQFQEQPTAGRVG
jgi:hypothetical protein